MFVTFRDSLRIGFLGIEYFGYQSSDGNIKPTSAHGGFGYLTRKKCEALAKMGHEVHVFIPAASYSKQDNVEKTFELNSVQIHLYKMVNLFDDSNFRRFILQLWEGYRRIKSLSKMLDEFPVDVYQSEEPYLYSYQAHQKSDKHVIVFQDPFDNTDHSLMRKAAVEYLSNLSFSETKNNIFPSDRRERAKSYFGKFSDNMLHIKPVKKILNNVPETSVYSEANFISRKVKSLFNLNYEPGFLPNPQDFFDLQTSQKSESPSILWLGRWDTQKRPDVALAVAKELPQYDFYFVGTSNDYEFYKKIQHNLRERYSKFPNIHILDFVSEERKKELLKNCWTLMNTSAREGLPISFLEAGANGMSIVSTVNPDNYSGMFGSYVEASKLKEAIKQSMEDEWFKTKGKEAYRFMKNVHETHKVMEDHVKIYEDLIGSH